MGYRDDVRYGVGEGVWTFWQGFWRIAVPLLFLGMALSAIGWLISVPSGVVQRVVNPDAIVQNYEWYESQYQDIQAADKQIDDAQKSVNRFKEEAGPRANWRHDEREEMARLNDVLDGLHFYRSKLVAEYNAKSRMITRTAWKRSDLPQHID